ncbi:MAG: four-carbon acid sugar kinase family protein [Treponemataceae bacterium]|nr:MAG: four-carbon acid sugar kinase family protein [Treponemataceae bacterium]
MAQCIVIADDLTGANATGVRLVKKYFSTNSLLNLDEIGGGADSDCIVCPTDSRSSDAKTAYERVFVATKRLASPEVRLYSKRIDTTLRGNLGSETDAMLDALGDEKRMAMIVPCFPSSKRILVGGCLLVDGVPLHKTAVAADPKTPVHTPYPAELFRAQSKYPVASVLMADVGAEKPALLVQKILDAAKAGVRNLIFDAATEEDVEGIAEGVIKSGVSFLAVDPGVFTSILAAKLIPVKAFPTAKETVRKVLAVVGSVNDVARKQVDYFLANETCHTVFVDTAAFLEDESRGRGEIERVVSEVLVEGAGYGVCAVIGRGIYPENRVAFEGYAARYGCTFDDLSQRINVGFAEIAWQILQQEPDFRAVYTCGGDITVAVCKRIKSPGLKLLDEVLPLAAYGEVMGGDFTGLKVISKGGMVGDANAIVLCTNYLKTEIQYE